LKVIAVKQSFAVENPIELSSPKLQEDVVLASLSLCCRTRRFSRLDLLLPPCCGAGGQLAGMWLLEGGVQSFRRISSLSVPEEKVVCPIRLLQLARLMPYMAGIDRSYGFNRHFCCHRKKIGTHLLLYLVRAQSTNDVDQISIHFRFVETCFRATTIIACHFAA